MVAYLRNPRTQRTLGRNGPSPDATALSALIDYENNVDPHNRLSGARFNTLRNNGATVWVPMTSGKPVPVTIRNPKAGKDLQSAIDEGFATGTLKKHQTALNTSRRVVNIRGGHHRVNEEIRAPGVDIRSAKGNYIVKAGAISVTGNSGTISIPGARVDNAKFGGFSGNLRFNGTGNNWDFRNAAFTVTGTGTPDLYGANTGNTMVNGKSFGGLVAAAAHNATNEHFGPTHSLSNFTMPSRRALQHAASAHVVLGSTPATFSHLSASAARHIQAEMHMNYGSSRVKPPELNYN